MFVRQEILSNNIIIYNLFLYKIDNENSEFARYLFSFEEKCHGSSRIFSILVFFIDLLPYYIY